MLGWIRLFTRSRVERTLLLAADEFAATLACERSRASRANSCFSLMTLSLRATELQPADLDAISEIFHQRRRATDLAGRMQDGRIGISLPDTNRAQAKVFAEALIDALFAKGFDSTYTISVYSDTETLSVATA